MYVCMAHMKHNNRGMLLYHNTHNQATAVLVSTHLKWKWDEQIECALGLKVIPNWSEGVEGE